MLNMKKVELELITDPDMYLFFEKGVRGGISYISNRCNKVNHQYLKSYDPKHESKHTIYYDANNLYGLSRFKWTHPKEFALKNYQQQFKRCVLEADLEYPKEVRELHNDYPLAPDKIEIKRVSIKD